MASGENMTTEKFLVNLSKRNPEVLTKVDLSLFTYTNGKTEGTTVCKTCGHKSSRKPGSLYIRFNCEHCNPSSVRYTTWRTFVRNRNTSIEVYFNLDKSFLDKKNKKYVYAFCKNCNNVWHTTLSFFIKRKLQRCPNCPYTTEDYLKELRNHRLSIDDKYDLNKVSCTSTQENIIITCHRCGNMFTAHAGRFMYLSQNCKCYIYKYNRKEFIAEIIKKHPNTQSNWELCSLVFTSLNNKCSCTCSRCGFRSSVQAHQRLRVGLLCPICDKTTYSWTHEEFLSYAKFRNPHLEKIIDFSGSEYKVSRGKIDVKCKLCGRGFKIAPSSLYKLKYGCPHCGIRSMVEKLISSILDEHEIKYDTEVKFPDCKYVKGLPFDFVIYDEEGKIVVIIEYQGKQHFEPISYWGGEQNLKMRKLKDKIKKEYCKTQGYFLYTPNYMQTEEEIEKELLEVLKERVEGFGYWITEEKGGYLVHYRK
jgi:transcription elongation factor Elf1